jgi:ribonuclease HI
VQNKSSNRIRNTTPLLSIDTITSCNPTQRRNKEYHDPLYTSSIIYLDSRSTQGGHGPWEPLIHDSAMPPSRSVRHKVHTAAAIPRPPPINCDRCSVRIEEVHYHCLESNGGDYDLCMKCTGKGIYCENDTHYWMKRGVRDGRHFDIGELIPPSITRTIHQFPRKTYPLKFDPRLPQDTLQRLFANEHRYIRKSDPREILIFTDGYSLDNGRNAPTGWAFTYRQTAFDQHGKRTHGGTISCRLENKGPMGQDHNKSKPRAALRAVIGALQFRDWSKDCNRAWRSVVIATSSQYVAKGTTGWLVDWELDGWKHFSGTSREWAEIGDLDLWRLLLEEVRKLQVEGVNVSVWHIPREWNARTEHFAKLGAEKAEVSEFTIYEEDGPQNFKSRPFLSGRDF